MATYERIADLPVDVDSYRLETLTVRAGADFRRHTTVVHVVGRGEEGVGEDVTYDTQDHLAFRRAGPSLPLSGTFSLRDASRMLEGLELFPKEPSHPSSRDYRRWAFESAVLDLALRQAGRSLADVLGIAPSPVRFVSSMGLGHPPEAAPLMEWLEAYPQLRFKLDASAAWDDALVSRLAATGAVDVIDLKGAYRGTPVDLPPDPDLYARVARGFPEAWIEDPALTPATERVLADHRPRITWDAPIHSVEDIRALPFPPRMLNFKPSRFGTLEALFDAYDYCRAAGIRMYGGGQWELGPGRGQIQVLASLFHAEACNDVAPVGYNAARPRPGLPRSPLEPHNAVRGFRRSEV